MWSAISRLFSKTNSSSDKSESVEVDDKLIMDRGEERRRTAADWEPQDAYDTRQAKQRASVKWLLSKAYNNRVPENLKEPFYRDHEDQEHLKPQIVHSLASAELYCLGLANIYSDPNYHNLNHWGIIQALARKGVYVAEPPDAQLTETVLIQTTPLKLSAHMAVIEAVMALYAKEVVTPDRVLVAVQRFSPGDDPSGLPGDHEDGLLLWVNRACAALRRRMQQELEQGVGPASPPADGRSPESATSQTTAMPNGVKYAPIYRLGTDSCIPSHVPSVLLVRAKATVTVQCHKQAVTATVRQVAGWDDSAGRDQALATVGCVSSVGRAINSCLAAPDRKQPALAPAAAPAASQSGPATADRLQAPDLPAVREWKDLCNGVSLAALISFYCPEELPWTDVVVSYLPTISDSVHNLLLVYNFCNRCLPSSVFHMMPEDVTYMQGSMKQNLIVFLADLFNVLEIHPVKCVRFPGTDRAHWKEVYPRNSQGVAHKRSFPQSISAIPDLRSSLGAHSSSFTVSKSAPTIQTTMPLKKSHSMQPADIHGKADLHEKNSQDDRRPAGCGGDESFVVHRGRAVPTLASVAPAAAPAAAQSAEEPLLPARLRPAKEKQNQDSKAEERGEPVAAGRPSNWEDQRRSSYAGRRSRRNSMSDDSQLTLENFGGSQENLHLLGRNPDKEPAVHVGRKPAAEPSIVAAPQPATAVRSSLQDARSSGVEMLFSSDNGYASEKQDEEKPTSGARAEAGGGGDHGPTSFAQLSRAKAAASEASRGINTMYSAQEDGAEAGGADDSGATLPAKSSILNKKVNGSANGTAEKKTTFAALPNNTTTWQQQSSHQQQQAETQGAAEDGGSSSQVMASQLHNIRMKLEEKRRRIESEKRRMEVVMSKQRQKVGKAAFLQAVSKGKSSVGKGAEPDSSKGSNGEVVDTGARPQRPLSLQEISDDVSSVEHKWLDNTLPYIEERRTPDIENMDLDQYQQSLAQMNSSLHEIQADIQRLATQQTQIQQSQQRQQSPPAPSYPPPHAQPPPQPQPQFYLHEQQAHRRTWAQPPQPLPDGPAHYAQDGYALWADRHQKPQPAPFNCQAPAGFTLHDSSGYPLPVHLGNGDMRYHNGGGDQHLHHLAHHSQHGMHHSLGANHMAYAAPGGIPGAGSGYQSFQLHCAAGDASPGPLYPGSAASTPPTSSPQHRAASVQQRISQMLGQSELGEHASAVTPPRPSPAAVDERTRAPGSAVLHAPVPTPPVDDMEPQSISFIGTPGAGADEGLAQSIKGLQISSGSRTYRIPSPTRPAIARSSFHHQHPQHPPLPQHPQHHHPQQLKHPQEAAGLASPPGNGHEADGAAGSSEKGFYISFDGDTQPKRPKPPLRVKRSSPKKERPPSQHDSLFTPERPPLHREPSPMRTEGPLLSQPAGSSAPAGLDANAQAAASGVGLVIGPELLNPDPAAIDEMERKKERIMLLSLQRRQQQEELKAHKEQEAQRRRDVEKLKQEERERKKEEERLRRAAILEQYKLKKAIEEAEREGKLLPDKAEPVKPAVPKRNKTATRPRPKTIHVDSGSVDLQEAVLSPSRSKKGSTSNLTDTVYSAPMRRDYYRGSQDSLADRLEERRGHSASLFKDSPDDGRGASPCRSGTQLGRRGSYKTSRDLSEPRQVRGRQKYPTYQGNFRGRKSNSLMNLCGSSTDQDSMVYRYTDTDSGLGRATPPRRAPSPGMSSMRHLPSPSGPGSLPPGLMTKRRMFDDGSSDISSTPSSMMEYTGPRLYKQPATKSNRGIMLNAVEYCVFPGVVNKEAKRRVLEEIARSESKHFLILFRDTGCQFRALYSYCPEREEVAKLYGTGPKLITDRMFDKFFKYNSGGKCFSQVHTKHLTVTIDAFTIHNSLWQGKKVALPNKKDMPLVI